MQGQVLDARLRLAVAGDVAHHHQARGVPGERHGFGDAFNRDFLPVTAHQGGFIRRLAARGEVLAQALVPFPGNELKRAPADHFVALVTRQAQHGLVDVADDQVLVEQNALIGGLRKLAHALLGQAQLVLNFPVLGDVGDQYEAATQGTAIVEMRAELDFNHPQMAIRQRLLAGVSGRLAGPRQLQIGTDFLPNALTHGLTHGFAQNGLGRPTVVFGVTAIGETAAQRIHLVIRD